MLRKPDACRGCVLYGTGHGFVPADGLAKKGVLMVLEAAGADEEQTGKPVVGKAGQYLWTQLGRVGLERDDFRIHNVLSCRPPGNELAGAPYEQQAIDHCSLFLDLTIADMREKTAHNGKPLVILALGKIAFKRLLGLDDKKDKRLLTSDYYCYPFWSDRYNAWVLSAPHPSYLMRGKHGEVGILQFAAQRAVEIAAQGLTLDQHAYHLDPTPTTFKQWVADYKTAWAADPDNTFLSYDIETPWKQGRDEDEVAIEDGDDYTILRISFAYKPNDAVSVAWSAEHLPIITELLEHSGAKIGWNNCPTPDQRVLTADLQWKPAGDLCVGDRLVGMDESVAAGRRLRRYKTTTVTHAKKGTAVVYRVSMSDGSSVKVTGEHRWLIAQRNRTKSLRKAGGSAWVRTLDLVVGQRVQRLLDTWQQDSSYDAGYLAGFFDGEGHLTKDDGGAMRVGAAQNNGPTLDKVMKLLDDKGFKSRRKKTSRPKDRHLTNFVIPNGINGSARFLGSIRPWRLLAKFEPECLGAVWHLNTNQLTITAIECLGEQEIVELSTSERTYLLEGFAAHNCTYDEPRIRAAGINLSGDQIDAMLAWHVLNSTLPKSLGFVTPYYAQTTSAWKHLSSAEPAFYNAKDADMALRNWLGIRNDLKRENLWNVFDRHVIQLNRVLDYMSKQGLKRDDKYRDEIEKKLQASLDEVNNNIEAAVPDAARDLKVYKKTPKDTTGMVQVPGTAKVKQCPTCNALNVKASHFKSIGKKRLKAAEPENPCLGSKSVATTVDTMLWAEPLPFRISSTSLQRYQKAVKHAPVVDWKTKRVTFDENAMKRLMRDYPNDRLYPLIGELRYLQKLLGTYVGKTQKDGTVKGGMPIGRDGLGHVTYSHNPSTLRLSCPFFHQLPRPGKPDEPHSWIRNMVVPREGNILLARDFSGIEAVLVGYEARFPAYIRLAKTDVHTFYTLYALYELERRIPASDLPDYTWPDDKLIPHLAHFKSVFKNERNSLYKHLTHAINFGQGPKGASETIYKATGVYHAPARIGKVMAVYKNLFPQIVKWQNDVREQAHKDGYLRNAFGYVHRFNHVYRYELEYGEWKRKPGDDAESVLAFKPQSNAAAIIKDAMLRLYQNHFDDAGQYLRLTVHDEVFCECPVDKADKLDEVMKKEMETPIECMPLPPSYEMGSHLVVLTEAKRGYRWGEMS